MVKLEISYFILKLTLFGNITLYFDFGSMFINILTF